jgi:hypothetical protein
VFYLDPSTIGIVNRDHITRFTSYSQYARVVERHPTEMLAGWARRAFNGLDVQYATVYIHDPDDRHAWLSLIDYTVLFVAAVRVIVPRFRHRLGSGAWPDAVALTAACIPSIPFAMESRYFLPIHLVLYGLVAFGAGTWLAARELRRRDQIALGVVYMVFLIVCFTLSTSTFALRAPG